MEIREKELLKEQENDILWAMGTIQGRRFMWRLLSEYGIYRDFEGSKKEILKQIGKRQAGLFLLGILTEASDDLVFLMMKEARDSALEEKLKDEHGNNDNRSTSGSNDNNDNGSVDILDQYNSGGNTVYDDLIGSPFY